MKNYIQEGKTLTVAAPAAVTSGQYVVVGAIRGVAAYAAGSGEQVELVTEGVFTLPKVAADDIAAGDNVYWDAAAGKVTKTAGTGAKPLVGVAVRAAGNGVANVDIKLNSAGLSGPA